MSFYVLPTEEWGKIGRHERDSGTGKFKYEPPEIYELKGPFPSIEDAAAWATERLGSHPRVAMSILEIPDDCVVRELTAKPVEIESTGTK